MEIEMNLAFPLKRRGKEILPKVNVLVAMLCLDLNWLSKTFEQEGKRP